MKRFFLFFVLFSCALFSCVKSEFAGDPNAEKPLLRVEAEYNNDIMRSDELLTFGFYVGNHPASLYKNVVKAKDAQKYLFKNIDMALLVTKIKTIKTKDNEDMAFILGEDESGSIEITVFPKVLKTLTSLKINDIIIINGKSSKRYDKYQIVANKIKHAESSEVNAK